MKIKNKNKKINNNTEHQYSTVLYSMSSFSNNITGEDIALIHNCLNSCMVALDEGDSDWFSNCYTNDGTCTITKTGTVKSGKHELKGLCDFLHGKFSHCKHWEGNVCIRGSDDNTVCTNLSYWKSLSGGEIVSTGIHRDVLQKDSDGIWHIKSRIIEHTYSKPI